MKSLIVSAFMLSLIFGLSGCSTTTQYKVNSNLDFEYLPVNERKTYEVFGKEQFIKEVKNDESSFGSFDDEFSVQENNVDPIEGYNRFVTNANDFMYMNILNPVATGYSKVVPETGRIAISNFLQNITYPIRLVNNLLQFKFANALEESERFLVNSTFGILGLMDPATEYLNLKEHNEDFGQTLGYYGFDGGLYIVLPVLGPSNVRDIVGLSADSIINPLSNTAYKGVDYKIPDRVEKTLAIQAFSAVNNTSLSLGRYESMKKDSVDLYSFFKEVYKQNRNKQIKE